MDQTNVKTSHFCRNVNEPYTLYECRQVSVQSYLTKVEQVAVHYSCSHAQCGLLKAAKAAHWRRWMKNPAGPA